MDKYLTDSEIMKWNERFSYGLDNVIIVALYGNNSNPSIQFLMRSKPTGLVPNSPGLVGEEIMEPFINSYEFTFSVSSNRDSEFIDLFNRLIKQDWSNFKTCYLFSGKPTQISLNENVVETLKTTKHKVFNKEYKRYNYKFKGKAGQIMAYVSYLEDTINIFSKIWGYNADGSETCLLDFPIGTVVSLKSDRSKNLIVLDYEFTKFNGDVLINYKVSEILNINNSVITYGVSSIKHESELCFSRDSRIDDILS